MTSTYEKYQKRKLISSYFSVILSIFLVLTLLGALSLFVINSERISNNFRENIPMTIFFTDKASQGDFDQFTKELNASPYIKTFNFVSKEEAAESQKEDLGENFLEFLGYNPLQNSYDLYIKGDYVVSDSLANIEKSLLETPHVDEILYDKQLVELVNNNITRITNWVLIIAGVLTIISMLLINSSLRLLIFSSRFTIKTMQMVGATKRFIRRPFIWHSIRLGLVGSILAVIALVALTLYLDKKFPDLELNPATNFIPLVVVGLGLILMGIIITTISTFFATQRFLNLKSDELY
ncbi:ABC transporter permease [Myroides sp. WP-1]|uniref:cell division protein FtsX n=1 Tax=Myroides sp. WP-1 TaxID=2759944 RepID=UPI0015F9CD17|nr:permease-like cell division protein FtsX [Myroides sp. WP-1]MBB1138313.1 FtsX-like permease family protein [Myroides sp. WP-1]